MGQDIKAGFDDLLKVITSLTTKTVVNSATSYSSATSILQDNINSTNCKNLAFSRQNNYVYVDTNMFQNQVTYQSLILSIVQQISSTQSLKSNGGITPQHETLVEGIQDIISTALTADVLTSITNSLNDTSTAVQNCVNSTGGINLTLLHQHDVYRIYSNLYSNNATIQAVAADISNYLSGAQAEKKTGILVTLMRMIAIIIVAICAVVVVGVIGFIALTVM